eukprot:2937349-Prymnesium_polylepis.1
MCIRDRRNTARRSPLAWRRPDGAGQDCRGVRAAGGMPAAGSRPASTAAPDGPSTAWKRGVGTATASSPG